jgi:hypothetical protein
MGVEYDFTHDVVSQIPEAGPRDGVTMVAVGVMVGSELRKRYKIKRLTPYDVYAHAGDEQQVEDLEFGLGT